jgi:hypothetical protein
MPDLNPHKRKRSSSSSGAPSLPGSAAVAAQGDLVDDNVSGARPAFAATVLNNSDFIGITLSDDYLKWVCKKCNPNPSSSDWTLTHNKISNIKQHVDTASHKSKAKQPANQRLLPAAWRAPAASLKQEELNELLMQVDLIIIIFYHYYYFLSLLLFFFKKKRFIVNSGYRAQQSTIRRR